MAAEPWVLATAQEPWRVVLAWAASRSNPWKLSAEDANGRFAVPPARRSQIATACLGRIGCVSKDE